MSCPGPRPRELFRDSHNASLQLRREPTRYFSSQQQLSAVTDGISERGVKTTTEPSTLQFTSLPIMFHFTPLLGTQSDSHAHSSLLELDGGIKILVDVGWDEKFDVGMLREIEK